MLPRGEPRGESAGSTEAIVLKSIVAFKGGGGDEIELMGVNKRGTQVGTRQSFRSLLLF